MRTLVLCILVTMMFVMMVQVPGGSVGQDEQPQQLLKTQIYLKTALDFKPELPDEGQTAEKKDAQYKCDTIPPGGAGYIWETYRTDVAEWAGDGLTDDLEIGSSMSITFWGMNADEDTDLDYTFWFDIYANPSGKLVYQTAEDSPYTVELGCDPKMVTFQFENTTAVKVGRGESLTLDMDFESNRDVRVIYDGDYTHDGNLYHTLSFLELSCNAVEVHDIKASESGVKVLYQNAFNSQLYWDLQIDNVPVQGKPVRDSSDDGKIMKWSVSSGSGHHTAIISVSYYPFVTSTGNATNGTTYNFMKDFNVKKSEEEGLLGQLGLPGFEVVVVAAAVSVALLLRKRDRG